MRDEATVDRIFAGDLDGLPNLSSRVGNILDFDVDVDPYSMGDLKHPLDLDHSVGVGGSLTTPSTSFCCCTWKTITQRALTPVRLCGSSQVPRSRTC